MKTRTKVSVTDIVVCVLLAASSILSLFFLYGNDGNTVEVKYADTAVSYNLNENRDIQITSNGHSLTLRILDGKASITESSCPDNVCVNSGETDDPAKPIICAPAKVIVRIKADGGDNHDADFIAGR